MEHLKYPIGKTNIPEIISSENISIWIKTIEDFPNRLEDLVKNLTQEQIDTPYRNGGWTVRQVVHHCYDSHHNSYTRFKWTLTEDNPVIKAYYEDLWAELFDSKFAPINLSLDSLKALHTKWVYLLKGLTEEEIKFKSLFILTEMKKLALKENIGIYAWHCNHHYAHIEQLLIRENWI